MATSTKYRVELSELEREHLESLFKRGRHSAEKLKRARILLMRDRDQHSVRQTSVQVSVSTATVQRACRLYCESGLQRALERQKQSGRPKSLEEKGVAVLCELAESKPPKGQKRWTLKLLADQLIELQVVDEVSLNTISRELKKRGINPM